MTLLFLCWFYVVSHSHEHHQCVTSAAKLGLCHPWQLVYAPFTIFMYYLWPPLPLHQLCNAPAQSCGPGKSLSLKQEQAQQVMIWKRKLTIITFFLEKECLRDFMEVACFKGFSTTSNFYFFFCWNWAGEDGLFKIGFLLCLMTIWIQILKQLLAWFSQTHSWVSRLTVVSHSRRRGGAPSVDEWPITRGL